MIKRLVTTVMLLASSAAFAVNWPWSETPEDNVAYCKGLVVGGLSSVETADVYRTDLWLAWNYLMREGEVGFGDGVSEYTNGRAMIVDGMTAEQVVSAVDAAEGSCGLGRSGHAVTGW